MRGHHLHLWGDIKPCIKIDKPQGKLLKKLRTIAWRFTVIKKNCYSVLLLHLLKPLFSVLHGLPAQSIFLF